MFLTECVRRGGNHTFTISFNRQQLADYLGVDRTSLCGELSRMRHDGLLDYHKVLFTVHEHTRIDNRKKDGFSKKETHQLFLFWLNDD